MGYFVAFNYSNFTYIILKFYKTVWERSTMKYMKTTLLTLIIIGLNTEPLFSQQSERLTPQLQKEIVIELSRLIKKEYVIEETGLKMAENLIELQKQGSFNESLSPDDFIKKVNQAIQSIYRDKHLGMVNREKFKELKEMFGIDEPESNEQDHKQPENHNKKPGAHGKEPEAHSGAPEQQGERAQSSGDLAGSRIINRDGRTDIGLLKINRFNGTEQGINEMNTLFDSFKGVDAVIIDLRGCKGGDADMVKILSSYFFNQSTYLVSTILQKDENGNRKIEERWTTPTERSKDFSSIPLYLLTGPITFSAAESFAFGIQLNNRATIVGETTGGGGHMNNFFHLPDGFGVSISVGRTYDRKTGNGFQSNGIKPDVEVVSDHAFAEAFANAR